MFEGLIKDLEWFQTDLVQLWGSNPPDIGKSWPFSQRNLKKIPKISKLTSKCEKSSKNEKLNKEFVENIELVFQKLLFIKNLTFRQFSRKF